MSGVTGSLLRCVRCCERPRGPCTVVLVGGPGIGKTSLWEAGIAAARESGFRALTARASDAEAELSFAALTDLLDGVDLGSVEGLPAPQRRALEVALLRVEPGGEGPSPRAIAFGFLNVARFLCRGALVLIAVDDLQWLDSASREVIAFAMRRLESGSIVFLLASRPGVATDFERASGLGGKRIDVGPLSLGAIRVLLSERLGLSLSRHALRRLVGVEELLEVRVAQLSSGVRRLLLAVALTGDLRVSGLPRSIDHRHLRDRGSVTLPFSNRPTRPTARIAVLTSEALQERRQRAA